MPIYDYKCDCGEIFEVHQSINDKKLKKCTDVQDCNGGKRVHRLISKPAIFSDDIGRGHKRMKDKDLYKELDIE